jgi:hypothetical protein
MVEIPQNVKFLLFQGGPKWHAQIALVVSFIGMATTILGIISAAIDNPLGLGATNWFLLTIVLFIWGLYDWLIAYFGAKEGYTR